MSERDDRPERVGVEDADVGAAREASEPADTGRLEAFSDGVFAVAVTLLVLDLHVPETASDLKPDVFGYMATQWPHYLAYVASFLFILVMWLNHHSIQSSSVL